MGRTSEFVNKVYGFPCETVQGVVVLGAGAAVEVLPNNPNRVSWTIFNLGGAIGYIAFTSAVGALFGMQINAAGDYVSSNARDDGEMPCQQLFGIGAGATTLYIVEVRAVK